MDKATKARINEYMKMWFLVDLLPLVTVNIGTLAES